jgi:hypothetical protein
MDSFRQSHTFQKNIDAKSHNKFISEKMANMFAWQPAATGMGDGGRRPLMITQIRFNPIFNFLSMARNLGLSGQKS